MIKLYLMEVSPLQNKELFEQGVVLVEPERREQIKKSRHEKDRTLRLAAGLLAGLGAAWADPKQSSLHDTEYSPQLNAGSKDLGHCVKMQEDVEWIRVTAEEAIRHLLSRSPVKIMRLPNGKPYYEEKQGLFLSLSHSGDYAVCAVSDTVLGVDIQKCQDVKSNLLKRILNPEEKMPSAEADFFRLWTAKEACVKCTGAGLSKDFRELFANFEKGEMIDTVTGECFRVYTVSEPTGYVLSVCTGMLSHK